MTALNGWVHDRFGTAWMLAAEAFSGIICIMIALAVLHRIKIAQTSSPTSA
jgi:predicted 3-demethylubiquinone-9 3-methyltransferase (glyoxalase superfamily)